MQRKPVSDIKNIWFNSEQVDDLDLTQEQEYNDTINSSIIGNHIGQGALVESLNQNVIFDSAIYSGLLDGTDVLPQNQPSDSNFGNQLEIELSASKAAGKRGVKVCVIGLDFEGNLQYERFVFKKNEKIIGKRHFTQILLLLFNDLIGPANQSFNLGGRVLIKEASPLSLSRDAIMTSQDVQPNVFFRDFFVTTSFDLNTLLKSALPTYNVDNLNINMYEAGSKILLKDDVTSHIGQKFLAQTNNIQKVTLLLSVQNSDPNNPTDLQWAGDLVISIYPLQTTIDCPTDIAPNLQIDFSPSNIPIAQLSYNYASLLDAGIILDSVAQPVDFIFSNTPTAFGSAIVPNAYYAITIKRSGTANKCDILIANGANYTPDSRVTLFSGNVWTDLPEEDLWFQVWTDSAKISSGQAYENGNGIIIEKTTVNDSGVTVDYTYDHVSFVGNDVFTGVVSSVNKSSAPVQDQRTGVGVNSRQQFVPGLSLLKAQDLANLEAAGDPFTVGLISDKNVKVFDSLNTQIAASLHSYSMVDNELLINVITDINDPRYDGYVVYLKSHLLNGNLVGAKIFPNASDTSKFYRVAGAEVCSMLHGDVNGDGVVDERDLTALNSLIGFNYNSAPPVNSSITTDNVTTTFTNGYSTLTNIFSNASSVSFQVVNKSTNAVLVADTDGVLVVNPNDGFSAYFSSANVVFNAISGLDGYSLVILGGAQPNIGGFNIAGIDTLSDVITIKKIALSSETLLQAMRADLNADALISGSDGYILSNYINRIHLDPGYVYPGPGSNPYPNIGKPFDVIRIKLEQYIDRYDEYTANLANRNSAVHPEQDIFLNDSFFASHNFLSSPVSILINKKFIWDEIFVSVNGKARLVPAVFSSQSGFESPKCDPPNNCNSYPVNTEFDPGRIDLFIPNNAILGEGGELVRPDGKFYKVDFEVGTLVLEMPESLVGTEKTIDILSNFVYDYNNTGMTISGFPAMRFADCSFVQNDAMQKDQLRFSVSLQSFHPNTVSFDVNSLKLGVYIDYSTGLLTVNFKNLQGGTFAANTKIQVSVYMKKAGFNNRELFVDATKLTTMLNLI